MVRRGPVSKSTTIVSLALLSCAWAVHATGLGLTGAQAGDAVTAPTRTSPSAPMPPAVQPEVTVPAQAFSPPVSVSARPTTAAAMSPGHARAIVASAVSTAIPSVALAAYQRAAVVIDEADPTCHLDWPLLAAIGRVESDHGSARGHSLSAAGIATPPIVGRVLDGHGVALVPDSDGGRYDGDRRFDRAVGPLQFIPSTWSMVSVDADGDGRRDPQDIDDASLAAGVYLCAGAEDLASVAGQRVAVLRYNHSPSYVSTVLRTARAYRSSAALIDAFPSGQIGYAAARALVTPGDAGPADVRSAKTRHGKHGHRHHGQHAGHGQPGHHGSTVGVPSPVHGAGTGTGGDLGPAPSPVPTPTEAPAADPTPTETPTESPTADPSADPARVGGGAAAADTAPAVPSAGPSIGPAATPTAEASPGS
ncbi:lytic murein transglycosylase [Nocardioides panacihumi]|uniref:Lytic murein transglycosylase n=1 Tax=Nocardioides panacihumi TaxID=400774 RepID=A0ABP5D4Z4_9ACTN